jgi:hypothetical protein
MTTTASSIRSATVALALLFAAPAFAEESTETAPAAEALEQLDAAAAAPVEPKPRAKKPVARKATDKTTKKASKTGKLDKTEGKVEGGQHWRITSESGPIHVWVPPGYDRSTAGTVVYVHGYHVDVDKAWKDYNLAKQFKASKQNAIFIVPEAPSSNDQAVFWPALTDLRKAVTRANIRLPDGPAVVIGHSGAFRTISKWVDHKAIAQVILLDALYGRETEFDDFIQSGKRAQDHKMILIGNDNGAGGKQFAKRYPFAVVRDKMPDDLSGFTKKEKKAKLLYVRSQYGHMQIVTSGKVIPLLLRLTPLKAL